MACPPVPLSHPPVGDPGAAVFVTAGERLTTAEGSADDCFLSLQDVVKVGAVDADKHQSLGGQYGVQGFPTIKIFGANKNKPEDYQGEGSLPACFGAKNQGFCLIFAVLGLNLGSSHQATPWLCNFLF